MGVDFDVIVIGGGPAGASCATFLAQAGQTVVLLEKAVFPRYSVGESLLPAVWDLLDALGVTEMVEASCYPIKAGVRFRLHADREYLLRTNEFPQYFSRPFAVHVDRDHFDRLLLDNARDKGVDVRQGCAVAQVLFENERAVGVELEHGKGSLRAPVVVDATGRATLLASRLGRRYNNPKLKKVSYYTIFEGAGRELLEHCVVTDIHTTEGGWIWYIPLRNDRASVGVVLDAAFVKQQTDDPEAQFARALAANGTLSGWLAGATQAMPLERLPAISYLSDDLVGDGFVMIGDAALFVDPIFSAGVTIAIRSAQFAAEAIVAGLASGDTSAAALKVYETRLRKPLEKIYQMILNWYEILDSDDRDHFFELSRKLPMLRERLIVLLSGGYDKLDMDALLASLEG